MSADNMGEPSMVNFTEVPPWLRTMLELQQQQMADMHASQQQQQRQFEEIQHYSSDADRIKINPLYTTRPPKERLGVPAYFDASNLALHPSWRLDMLAKLNTVLSRRFTPGWKLANQHYVRPTTSSSISMSSERPPEELLQALVSVEAPTHEAFCIQLRTLDDRLTKLKSIQAGGRKCYTPATNTPAPKNNADAMDWVDSNVYAQARVSTVRTGFRVPGIAPEDAADRRQRGF
ncbi:hypothetical protein EMCG_03906 [[Emmonsia] crescens]|uniref:Uncharacterized protein n=1 Tax=[Emmonsia] crescens TaxID=73230 RepID=A0A0G2HUS8_9EURO|nr:hypothetical protein EMCG_03906 [Emmonsia crescens UAMH 3008]